MGEEEDEEGFEEEKEEDNVEEKEEEEGRLTRRLSEASQVREWKPNLSWCV